MQEATWHSLVSSRGYSAVYRGMLCGSVWSQLVVLEGDPIPVSEKVGPLMEFGMA